MQTSTPASADDLTQSILDALTAGGDTGLDWLSESMETTSATPAEHIAERIAVPFAEARRRAGAAPLGATGPLLETACGELQTERWGRDDAARACLLMAAMSSGVEPAALVDALFRGGDEGERTSLIKSLCLLPDPAAALATARAAGRTNSMLLYAALALDNPYPACCYNERDFNQVVLKCLFNGLPIARIPGLSERANPTLSQMCEDYHDERVAAGRSVPADIWLALVPHAGAHGLALATARLEQARTGHAQTERVQSDHAHFAAQALGERRDIPTVGATLEAYEERGSASRP